jgi:hypothetical protein
MSCGWLKNLEVLAERPCAAVSIGSRNLSPLKTGSAPRETEGTHRTDRATGPDGGILTPVAPHRTRQLSNRLVRAVG